jgi:hypothetical protein
VGQELFGMDVKNKDDLEPTAAGIDNMKQTSKVAGKRRRRPTVMVTDLSTVVQSVMDVDSWLSSDSLRRGDGSSDSRHLAISPTCIEKTITTFSASFLPGTELS